VSALRNGQGISPRPKNLTSLIDTTSRAILQIVGQAVFLSETIICDAGKPLGHCQLQKTGIKSIQAAANLAQGAGNGVDGVA
jgi:hypothetical protein